MPEMSIFTDRQKPLQAGAAIDMSEYRAVFDNPAVGIMILCDGAVRHCNAALERMYDCASGALAGLHVDRFAVCQTDCLRYFERAAKILRRGGVFTGEAQACRADGSTFWIRTTARLLAAPDDDECSVWIVEDITGRKTAEETVQRMKRELDSRVAERTRELELANARLHEELAEQALSEKQAWHAAHHDPMTGLANRVLLLDRLQHALPMARRHGRHAALMYIDLDHFKRINDTCGHDVGDRFLCVVAARLQESVRATDLVARIGGDEFVVLLEDIGRDRDASLVARKMLRLLAEPMRIGPHTLSAMASIGIGLFPDHAADVETLMRRADSAMYRAKAKGRNAIEVYGAQDDPAQPTRQ